MDDAEIEYLILTPKEIEIKKRRYVDDDLKYCTVFRLKETILRHWFEL